MFSIACILLASLCVVDSSTIMRCSENATFHFVEDETPNITCSGFPVGYWSLTGPSTGGQEIRIGDCSKCGSGEACSCITNSTDYNITRNGDISTLFFVDNLSGNNHSTITCSKENNKTCVTSTINIIKAPVRCQHASNCIEIVEDQPTPITCQGGQNKDIYWSVTRPSTPEIPIGNCSKCATQSHLPCTCHTHNGDYSITRTGDNTTAVSILQFVNNVSSNDNSTIKCSTFEDNQTLVSVSIKVIPDYALPQCTEGRVYVSEKEPWTHITCDGVASRHNMNWTLTDDSGLVIEIAECYGNGTCTEHIDDVTVSKNESASTLTFVKNARMGDNQTLTCTRRNGETSASCRIQTFYDDPEPFPLVVVGVAVGATVLAITIVIAIVVVVARHRVLEVPV
ncbi:uncharacterized protein [Littorina saxatilis]|uniref:uncharacterized protein n=1 Tax=Littorina saxatilis TaxID=31220 RepID=UPI0038B64217